MKRKLWIGLVLVLLIALLCCGAAMADANGTCGENLTWTFKSDTGTLSISGTGAMTDYNSYSQTPWYSYEEDIQSISINSGVTSIGRRAFYSCTSLTSVTIPRNVTIIGYLAFTDCSSLTSVIILNPDAVIGDDDHDVFRDCPSSIVMYGWNGSTAEAYASAANMNFTGWASSGKCGDNATWSLNESAYRLTISGTGATWDYYDGYPGFYSARIAVESIYVEEGITELGGDLFYRMDHVYSLSIPDSLTSIGGTAFSNCTKLESLNIPYNVTSIGARAFYGCTALRFVEIYNPSANIGQDAFGGCGGVTICGYSGSTAIAYASGNSLSIVEWPVAGHCGASSSWSYDIAAGRLSITGTGDMYDYSDSSLGPRGWDSYKRVIKSVVIGEGVTSVGGGAFSWFFNLTSVTIPASVTKIGASAFSLCTELTDVKIPEGVTEICENAFYVCSGLKTVTIPNSLTSIGRQAFVSCISLGNVTLPNSVASIGDSAFAGCSSQKDVTIYNMDAAIGTNAFNTPDTVIHGWPYSTAKAFANANGLTFQPLAVPDPDFFLPASLTAINSEAFAGIKAKAPVIPKSVTSITGNPFADSDVQVIYGYYSSAADTFAANYGYYFVGIDDAWMASHKP